MEDDARIETAGADVGEVTEVTEVEKAVSLADEQLLVQEKELR